MLMLAITDFCNAQSNKRLYATGCLPETNIAGLPKQATLMERDFKYLPSSCSLKQYCPIPQSQGQFGTCTSWATAYAFRTILEAIRNNWTNPAHVTEEAFSPLFIYAQIKNPYDVNCSKGSHISEAMKRLQEVGAVKKSIFDLMCANVVPNDFMNKAALNRIGSFSTLIFYGQNIVESVKISLIKKAISEKQPVVIAMHVFPSFDSCKDVWDGSTMGIAGYHAMCVVGYDDNKYGGAFLLLNSWGEHWGNGGYAWVRYDDFCKTVDQAYTGALPYTPSPVVKKNRLGGEMEIKLSTGATMQTVLNKQEIYPYYKMRGSYISGTRYRLLVTNNEPAYVYIIGHDLQSNTNLVFPPREDISPALTYKQSHISIPDEKWYIEMDNNLGKDYVCVLYSLTELDIKNVVANIKLSSGTIYERLQKVLGKSLAPAEDVVFVDNKISFETATSATIVPIIAEIIHE